ncbi:accB acetyl-CoA carboxylase, biotin carboxyl carrier protein [Thermacetogenium phaeum DSM 12270]|uniref:AccB acetyl-CoA carboxylase, biotin carboxyl carrier protein n=2 Tax=Thermacetogenium phaeum TaxID=85874 RepID=K4LG80_THEPS|nr:acetyl-CoA carboxylase biotin carboxyl carrier protein [Thermacetogenium phaeum]AFV11843.1 accB acetyl-CoA carboxylase, biotin carboxyl carrier protein [Thermacetogenium phaeum DSM 12270]KUK36350.1 MAG: AccB acetyl-CoA carboxylase, biotin carboxyl carrier protein [Thermacetogenium phaeum]
MEGPKITDTTLRDAHQSLWATRMRTEDMVPVLEKLDEVGYFSLEMWGGATFDVCIRYLNEDPWDRIRIIKKHVKKTPLQMLLRGQNLVGYANYPDDVVEAFVDKAAEVGIDIFRVFDALNDVRNLEVPMRAVKKTGKHLQACVVYTLSPVHTNEHYLETALRLQDLGADSICIKDMAGMIAPYVAYELVSLLKEKLDVPIQLHTHYIGGMAIGACLKAVEAGVDVFDACSGPLAFGSSQPPVETLVRALQGTPWDTGLDLHLLFEISNYWEELRRKRGFERGVTRISDMKVFDHQVPGGMISNLVSQLEEQKALHRIGEVLEEIPRVRADLGYPPLVTPTSQIVGIQAVFNVLTGERYKMVPQQVKDYVRGFYGKPPGKIDEEVRRLIIGDEQPITCRPADLLERNFDKLKEEIKDLAKSEEDYLTYALFPAVARKFFEYREKVRKGEVQPAPVDEPAVKPASGEPAVKQTAAGGKQQASRTPREDGKMMIEDIKDFIKLINETDINELEVETPGMRLNIRKGITGSSTGNSSRAPIYEEAGRADAPEAAEPAPTQERRDNLVEVVAPMVGTFYRAPAPGAPPFVDVGSKVKKGDTLCIIEAMKLMNEIEAECDGEIVEILVENAQPVEYGQVLFLIASEG